MKTTLTIAVKNEYSADMIKAAIENQKYYHAAVYLRKSLPFGVFLVPVDLRRLDDPTNKIVRIVLIVWVVKE